MCISIFNFFFKVPTFKFHFVICVVSELYGFDILVDAELKPWLLEVNLSPSLGCDTLLDTRLKSALLTDLLTLIGIPAVDPVTRPNCMTKKRQQLSLVSLGLPLIMVKLLFLRDRLCACVCVCA